MPRLHFRLPLIWLSTVSICILLVAWSLLPLWVSNPACLPQTSNPSQPSKTINSAELQRLAALAATGFVAMPSPEQLAEEQQIDAEQVNLAKQWLDDAETEQRVAGAEQLAAYPTPEAERYLLTALQQDEQAAVREAAAISLSAFQPSAKVLAGLFAALTDADDAVGMAAFASFQGLMAQHDGQQKWYRQYLGKLKKLVKSPRLAADTREAIVSFLADIEDS